MSILGLAPHLLPKPAIIGFDGGAAFTPASLFAAGEQGLWYDLSALFQDHLGTVPAAVGQPVGLMLDKSKGGPVEILNSPEPKVKTAGVSPFVLASGLPIVVGRTYELTFSKTGHIAGVPGISFAGTNYNGLLSDTGVDKECRFFMPAASTDGTLAITGAAAELTISNLTIREIPGNHASQPTVTARPTLGREPKGGRRNRLRLSESFSSGLWITGEMDTTPVEVLPGIMGVDAKVGGNRFAVYDRTNSAWILPRTDWPISSGRFSYTFTAPEGCTEANVYPTSATTTLQIYSSASNSVVTPGQTYTVSMHVHNGSVGGVQLEEGSVMTPYQRVGYNAFDVTEAGVETLNYLDFDGVDDFMTTPVVDFTTTDELLAIAGVHKLNLAGATSPVILNGDTGSTTGAFALYAPHNVANRKYGWSIGGTSQNFRAVDAGFDAPHTAVQSMLSKISSANAGDRLVARLDGAPMSTFSANLAGAAAPTFRADTLRIGVQGTFFFRGRIYGLLVRGKLPTADELMAAERFIAQKTGVTL